MFRFIAVALLLGVAAQADAQSCRDGKNATLIPGNDPFIHFPNDVPVGTFAHSGGNGWDTFPGWPDPNDPYLDILRLAGTTPVCWFQGYFYGPMGPANDANTYYHCPNTSDWPEHGYPGSGPCLPYHSTAAFAPDNSSGSIAIENSYVSGIGDGVSLPKPLPYKTDVFVMGSYFDYIHDDTFEDDHCVIDWWIEDNYVASAFMLVASRKGGGSCSDSGTRVVVLQNNIVRLYRFAHAYKNRLGHGGLWKRDDVKNPRKTITGNKFLLGPIAGDQSIFPPVSEIDACAGNVVLWDGLNADYDTMLTRKNNGANLHAIQGVTNPPFPGCFAIVKRETRCPSCSSAQFLGLALPELGNKSWNQITSEWMYGHGFAGSGNGCGIGPELALVLPLLGVAWRLRAQGRLRRST